MKKVLIDLARHFNVKGLRGLAKHLGVPESRIYSWTKKGRIANTGLITSKFPEISEDWLKTGKGAMIAKKRDASKTAAKYAQNMDPNFIASLALKDPNEKFNILNAFEQIQEILNSTSELRAVAENNIHMLYRLYRQEMQWTEIRSEFKQIMNEIESLRAVVTKLQTTAG